jgi:hypothetical protein
MFKLFDSFVILATVVVTVFVVTDNVSSLSLSSSLSPTDRYGTYT